MKDNVFGIIILLAVVVAIIWRANVAGNHAKKDIFDEYVEYADVIRSKLSNGEFVEDVHFETLERFEFTFKQQAFFVERANNEIKSLKNKNIAQIDYE